LDFFEKFFDGLSSVRKSFLDIELLSERVFVEIMSDIFIGINNLRVRHNTFDC
jgi:hypothetical protein